MGLKFVKNAEQEKLYNYIMKLYLNIILIMLKKTKFAMVLLMD